mmetsp:Transcript_86199/g.157185  ORF Transcript_86199/g.157185 Transcript_86199/m.157185 type:complete len:213 (+) Transcript_86199:380-1018(+)
MCTDSSSTSVDPTLSITITASCSTYTDSMLSAAGCADGDRLCKVIDLGGDSSWRLPTKDRANTVPRIAPMTGTLIALPAPSWISASLNPSRQTASSGSSTGKPCRERFSMGIMRRCLQLEIVRETVVDASTAADAMFAGLSRDQNHNKFDMSVSTAPTAPSVLKDAKALSRSRSRFAQATRQPIPLTLLRSFASRSASHFCFFCNSRAGNSQ